MGLSFLTALALSLGGCEGGGSGNSGDNLNPVKLAQKLELGQDRKTPILKLTENVRAVTSEGDVKSNIMVTVAGESSPMEVASINITDKQVLIALSNTLALGADVSIQLDFGALVSTRGKTIEVTTDDNNAKLTADGQDNETLEGGPGNDNLQGVMEITPRFLMQQVMAMIPPMTRVELTPFCWRKTLIQQK